MKRKDFSSVFHNSHLAVVWDGDSLWNPITDWKIFLKEELLNIQTTIKEKKMMIVDCDSTINKVDKEKVTLKEFQSEMESRLDGYEIDLQWTLDELRESYEVVDEEGNSIDNKIDWDDFSSYASVEIEYDGELLTPQERLVRDFKRKVNFFKDMVNGLWEDIQKGECTQRQIKDENGSRNWNSFGSHLQQIISSYGLILSKEQRTITQINEMEDVCSEEKDSLISQIGDLRASVEDFISQGAK